VTPPTRLVLVRHGETASNRERRFQGYDVPLSAIGRQQAERVAARLGDAGPADALYTSDLARAAETAATIAARLGQVPVVERALRELDVGDLKGRLHREFEEEYPGGYEGWIADGGTPRLPGPAGESLDDLVGRAVPVLMRLLARHRGERVIVVSHGLTLGVLLAHAHGWEQREAFATRRVRFLNTSVSEIHQGADGRLTCPVLASVDHLDADLMGAGSGLGAV
jgi:probable phosphoglycerate mutase